MHISTIIPVHNGGQNFRTCLHHLASTHPRSGEVIVVINGDSNGSCEAAQAFGAQVIVLPDAVGPARARNVGAQAAKGDILFFIDADVAVHADVFRRIEQAFALDTAAIIGSYDDAPGAPNFLSQYKNLMHHYVHQISNEEASTFWGACGAIQREVFMAMGGFDESYRRPCIEDIELGYRLRDAGYHIRLVKDLQVKHLKHWTGFSLLKSDFFDRALPWTALLMRYPQFANDLNVQRSSRLSVGVSYFIVLSLIGAFFVPLLLILTLSLMLILVTLNAPVYQFFWLKRGWGFALRALPMHWLYYLYSGLAFALGTARYSLWKMR